MSLSQVLSERLVEFAQFIPEKQRKNGVWTESEIRRSQAFVKPRQSLLLQGFGKAVSKSFIELTLKNKRMVVLVLDPPPLVLLFKQFSLSKSGA